MSHDSGFSPPILWVPELELRLPVLEARTKPSHWLFNIKRIVSIKSCSKMDYLVKYVF